MVKLNALELKEIGGGAGTLNLLCRGKDRWYATGAAGNIAGAIQTCCNNNPSGEWWVIWEQIDTTITLAHHMTGSCFKSS